MTTFNIRSHTIISSLRDAFISLTPYYIITSLLILAEQLLSIDLPTSSFLHLTQINKITYSFHSIFLFLALSYFLAEKNNLDSFFNILLSFSVLMTTLPYYDGNIQHYLFNNNPIVSFGSILIPIYCTYSTVILKEYLKKEENELFSISIIGLRRNIVYFVILYMSGVFSSYLLLFFTRQISFGLSLDSINKESLFSILILSEVIQNIFTFIGLHGVNTFNLLFNLDLSKLSLQPNLSLVIFGRLFFGMGGAGNCLSLALAFIILTDNKKYINTIKISLPFMLFGISELFIFGLPVIFNRYLFIPFVTIAILDGYIIKLVLDAGLFHFNTQTVAWTTPPFLNIYLSTGSYIAVFTQVFLFIVNTIFYLPFVKRLIKADKYSVQTEKIQFTDRLKVELANRFRSAQFIQFQKTQNHILKSHYALHHDILDLLKNDLLLYYQPKINIKHPEDIHMEALIRIRQPSGKLRSPYFLKEFETSGLITMIDHWVCLQVKRDLEYWGKQDFHPSVSINISANTLYDCEIIKHIGENLSNFPIEFEILEKALVDMNRIGNNLDYLRDCNFKFAIDDFGTGYSSLQYLTNVKVDTIKIDRSIVSKINTQEGKSFLQRIVKLCHSQHYKTVIEGIQTKEELSIAMTTEVNFIQGHYFSIPLSMSKIMPFYEKNIPKIKNLICEAKPLQPIH